MVAKSTIQQRGQVTLPKKVRELAQISPGDLVSFEVTGPHEVIIKVIPVKPLEYFWDKYRTTVPFDDDANREEWHAVAADDAIRE